MIPADSALSLRVCMECGCCVRPDQSQRHSQWHKNVGAILGVPFV